MGELEVIRGAVRLTARRQQWLRAIHGLWRGLLIGALVWLVTLLAYKILPLPPVTLAGAGLLAVLALAGGFATGWLRPPSLSATARWIDAREQFQERLSTALELAARDESDRWSALVLADAAAHARQFSPRTALPHRLPGVTRWALLVLALAFGLGFVPEYRSQRYLEQRRHAEIIRETGRRLEELVRRELEQRPPILDATRQALESVDALASQLANARLTRADALEKLASATDRLRDQARDLGRNPSLRRLDAAARLPGGSSATSPPELQKQIDALQEQLGGQADAADAADRLARDLDGLAQAAAKLPGGDSAAARQAREQLGQALSELTRRAEQLGLDAPQLDAAIKALEAGQIDKLLRELKLAEMDLQQLATLAKSLRDLQAQLAEIGKDLAEQLEQGQGLPAIATLQRMIKQLQAASVPEAARQAMLDEVRRAVEPGSQYGQVGDFLRRAAQGLEQGNRDAAGDALAKAADELRALMDQLADAEGLEAALDGLQTAQMAVGNGMAWGLCRAQLPSFKPGGKPGRGVGTWADETTWLDTVENTGLWDNTGVERPDQVPHGESDRGPGQLSDALSPTRVRGQISPGGPMPSVTLRGVSIRGQSRVAYEQAVNAAQSEARSALNQDRVPRVYQGAVRDYFDDLKE